MYSVQYTYTFMYMQSVICILQRAAWDVYKAETWLNPNTDPNGPPKITITRLKSMGSEGRISTEDVRQDNDARTQGQFGGMKRWLQLQKVMEAKSQVCTLYM